MKELISLPMASLQAHKVDSEFAKHKFQITASIYEGASFALDVDNEEAAMEVFDKIQNDLRHAFEGIMTQYFEPG